MANKSKNHRVLAKTSWVGKIAWSVFFLAVTALAIFGLMENRQSMAARTPPVVLFAIMALLQILAPIRAIVFDEDSNVLVIRGGVSLFECFKKRTIELNRISKVKVLYSRGRQKGLYIYYAKGKTVKIFTIRQFEQTADAINLLIKEKQSLELNGQIEPFYALKYGERTHLYLKAEDGYRQELFKTREAEGFSGTGRDWESLAKVVLKKITAELVQFIEFDSDDETFCAYSSSEAELRKFAVILKETCENDVLLTDLFAKAEIFSEQLTQNGIASLEEKS